MKALVHMCMLFISSFEPYSTGLKPDGQEQEDSSGLFPKMISTTAAIYRTHSKETKIAGIKYLFEPELLLDMI